MAIIDILFGEDATVLSDRDFILLLFATTFAPLGVGLVSPVLDSLIDPFGVSPTRIGLVVSAITGPGIFLIPLVGVLSDRYGRKMIIVFSLVLLGGAGVAISFTTSFHLVLGLRVVQGIGLAGLNPTIITSIGDLYEDGEEATAQGLRFTIAGLASVVFPFLAGVIVTIAWQFPFLLYGIAALIALVVYIWFEEPSGVRRSGSGPTDETQLARVFQLAIRRRVLAMLFARGLMPMVWFGFMTYISIIVVRILGGTPQEAGLLVAVASAGWAATASQAGRITNLFGSRFYPLIGANLCFGLGFVSTVFAPSISVAGLGIVLSGFGLGVLGSLYRSVITGLSPEDLRGGLVSLGESLSRVTSTLTPIVMGYTIDIATPVLGFADAVRWTVVVASVVGSFGGILAVLVARRSIPHEVE